MATYELADDSVKIMAATLIVTQPHLEALKCAEPTLDFIFAYAPINEKTGVKIGSAIRHRGHKALAQVRLIPVRRRVAGCADAEIIIDADHWKEIDEDQQQAILDHELYHLAPTGDKDDAGRPKLTLRPHDFDVGWFAIIAKTHGAAAVERIQANTMYDAAGQFFWPGLYLLANSKITVLESVVSRAAAQ